MNATEQASVSGPSLSSRTIFVSLLSALLALATLPTVSNGAILNPEDFDVTGRITHQTSLNMQDLGSNAAAHPLNPATFSDNRWEASMIRNELWLEMGYRATNWIEFKTILRGVKEVNTDMVKKFDNANGAPASDVDNTFYDRADVRELYADINLTDNIRLRLGKQQFVMGKTDFFQALDMVHGRDLSWRLFLEPNEQWRKTNWMAKASIDLGADWWNITLQPFWIPGFDRQQGLVRNARDVRDLAVGKTGDFTGGRWQLQGGEGLCVTCAGPTFTQVSPLSPNFGPTGNLNLPINASHPSGNLKDESFGLRAMGMWEGFGDAMSTVGLDGFYGAEWSIAYMHVFHNGPFDDNFVINARVPNLGVTPKDGSIRNPGSDNDLADVVNGELTPTGFTGPSGNIPVFGNDDNMTNAAAELIYPMMDVVGFSANTYYQPLGAVIRTEMAMNIDKSYNLGPTTGGMAGVTEIDSYNLMFGMDWGSVDWTQTYLFTDRPSTINVQVFDEFIPGASDRTGLNRIVDIAGGAANSENHMDNHQVVATVQMFTHYWNDNLNPTLFAGTDLTNGGGFVVPAISYSYGTNWRFKLEADIFFEEGSECAPPGCHLFDALDDKNQLMGEITYQF